MLAKIILKRGWQDGNYQREKISKESSTVGLLSNLFLAVLKVLLYTVTGSISILADAVNNITDCASSVISIIGVYLSSRPGDKDHPYGHGRIEYVIALVVSGFVLATGVEFIRASVVKIFHPTDVVFTTSVLFFMVLSLAVKFWQAKFYGKIADSIDSSPVRAQSADSLSDCLVTSVVILSIVLQRVFQVHIDGYVGAMVALFILYSSYCLIRDTLSELIGRDLTAEKKQEIISKVSSYEYIYDVHDIIATDFGPEKTIVMLDVEMPYYMTLEEAHGIVDRVEREVSELLDIDLFIHVDPRGGNEEIEKISNAMNEFIRSHLNVYSFHDVVIHSNRVYLDLSVNGEEIKDQKSQEELCEIVQGQMEKQFPQYDFIINIDRTF